MFQKQFVGQRLEIQLRKTTRSEISTEKANKRKRRAATQMKVLELMTDMRKWAEQQALKSSKQAKYYETQGDIQRAQQRRDFSRQLAQNVQFYNRYIDQSSKKIEALQSSGLVRLQIKKNYVLDIKKNPPSNYSDEDW